MAEQKLKIENIYLEGIEKRLQPTKHYAYVMRVERNRGKDYHIARRYKQFLRLQTKLSDLFPNESGAIVKEDRIIPFVPGKAAKGKNHLRSTAVERISYLENFCQRLIELPDHVSQCQQVKHFFAQQVSDGDLNSKSDNDLKTRPSYENVTIKPKSANGEEVQPKLQILRVINDFIPRGNNKSQVTILKGETVEVLEKLDIGWWYVEAERGQGWVPRSCLENTEEDGAKIYATIYQKGKPYVVSKTFKASENDELSITKGAIVIILEKNSSGWWLAEFHGIRGLVPGCNLARKDAAQGIRLVAETMETKEETEVTQRPEPKSNTTLERKKRPGTTTTTPSAHHRFGVHDGLSVITEDEELESSSDEDEEPFVDVIPEPPPPRISLGQKESISLPPILKAPVDKKVFRAAQDYSSPALGAIHLRKGQEVQVLPRPVTNGWMEVRVEGKTGFVPVELIEETERKPEDKKKADVTANIEYAYWTKDPGEGENFLQSFKHEGAYMIRKSKTAENQETLLVWGEARMMKYKIQQKEDGGISLMKNSATFASFNALVDHYSKNVLPKTETKLTTPYKKLFFSK